MREHSIPWSKKKTRAKETDIPEPVMITDNTYSVTGDAEFTATLQSVMGGYLSRDLIYLTKIGMQIHKNVT